jgi:hypothetical protein
MEAEIFELVLLIISTSYFRSTDGGSLTDYKNVHSTVLTGYNTDARPVTDQSNAMNVSLEFYLITVSRVNEVTGELVTVGSFNIAWTDEVIKWNSGSYGGTESINIDESLVWKPSMTFLNPMKTDMGLIGFKGSKIKYYYDGKAHWDIADRYQTTCDFNSRYFPFDKQTCHLKVMTWGYDTDEVLMYPRSAVVNLTYFTENGAWILASTETKFETLGSNSVAVFTLNLERRPLFFVANLFVPVSVILLLNTLVFVLPAESGERVGYSITCLLALTVFLTIMSDYLPRVSKPMPAVVYILATYLVVSALICVANIFILNVHHRNEKEEISIMYKRFYNCLSCLCCKKRSRRVEDSQSENNLERRKNAGKQPEMFSVTWEDVASCFDKICFISSVAGVIIVGAIFFVYA